MEKESYRTPQKKRKKSIVQKMEDKLLKNNLAKMRDDSKVEDGFKVVYQGTNGEGSSADLTPEQENLIGKMSGSSPFKALLEDERSQILKQYIEKMKNE
jgi:hypothetical protein